MSYHKVSPRSKERKTKTTLNRTPVLRTLKTVNTTLEDLKLLLKVNNNPEAIVEITKLLLLAYAMTHIAKVLF